MRKGITYVEMLLSFAAISVVTIGGMSFLFQALSARDKAISNNLATDAAQAVLERISNSIKAASGLEVLLSGNAIALEGDQCVVYSLSGGRIYYDQANPGDPCPAPSTNTPITPDSVQITNQVSPSLKLFSGIPNDTSPTSIQVSIKSSSTRPFSSSEVILKLTTAKRR
jgi:hypothetical protein